MTIDLTKKPFYLTQKEIDWVKETRENMSTQEKIRQLFMLAAADAKDRTLQELAEMQPGGVMLRPLKEEEAKKVTAYLNEHLRIQPFISANLETGPNGINEDAANIGHEMLIAATNNIENAYKFGKICMADAKKVGGNMSFAPIIDINFNWQNPITNIRSFGDRPDLVSEMGQAYVEGAQEAGGTVTIKHFPGDGADDRDHHIVKSRNPLSYEDWMASYGKVYRENIDAGATGVMIGHIAFPHYFDDKEDTYRQHPASLNPLLINRLLREELGFNGLTITDSTLMTGFGVQGRREDMVPLAIASGCDMFLFTKNSAEDFTFMMQGYKNGIITPERLDEAVYRILGLKAYLQKKERDGLLPTTLDGNQLAKEVADQGVTLVKDAQNLLPLSPAKHKKVGIISLGNEQDIFDMIAQNAGGMTKLLLKMQKRKPKAHEIFGKKLSERGYEVIFIDHSDIRVMMESAKESIAAFRAKYDVILYFVKKDTMSNQTSLRAEFKSLAGFDAPWFIHEVPTALISVASPYHGYDFADVMTVINGYSPTEEVLEAIIEKMEGRSEFRGVSPVDLRFCEEE
ncbi:glycoside hydrolase family 3 protein [Listeria costaricensis]|uniref:glycoside hydrolase family 3 protein n=1 Tax=Listeria costaricensis TaxID=2026604 RepID=UPI000C06924A|nr:glycoside hydrolase family 3 N-terminal domain-containing protein [Listeria costaricensis]